MYNISIHLPGNEEKISCFTCIRVFMSFDKEINSGEENSANFPITPRTLYDFNEIDCFPTLECSLRMGHSEFVL